MKPVLFTIGLLEFQAYYFLIVTGGLVTLIAALTRARRLGFPKLSEVIDVTLLTVFTGFWGAKILGFVLAVFKEKSFRPLFFLNSGLMLYGSLFTAILSLLLYLYFRKRMEITLKGLDFSLPFFALIYAFVKIGCFLNGCCYGEECDLPWAVKFPATQAAVHPAQLYEALYNFILFVFLSKRYERQTAAGETTALFFFLFAAGRFLIGLIRQPDEAFLGGLFTFNQSVEIAMMLFGLIFYTRIFKAPARQRNSPIL